jgi:hypothetical protein
MDVLEVPIPDLKSGMVLVRNYYSLISAGTEGQHCQGDVNLLCMRIGLVNGNDNC